MEPIWIRVCDARIPSDVDGLATIWLEPSGCSGCCSSLSGWGLDFYPFLDDDLLLVVVELCEENNLDLVI